ncbi:MAG: response regulator [Bacteroidales bacterium]|nr:response regulator [Bacteroidales bacterium]
MDKKLILIIDDSSTNIVLLETVLSRNGYEVASARGAMEGIAKIKKRIPDLIYLDLIMPDVDGLRFMEIIHDNIEWQDIPVVIISAISDGDIKKRSLKMGVTSYITKPVNIDRIVQVTREIVEQG